MSRCRCLALLVFIGVTLLGANAGWGQNSIPDGTHVAGELLLASKAGVSDTDLEDIYKGHGGQKIKTLPQIRVHHIKVPARALEVVEAALRNNPKVQFVEKNFIAQAVRVPNDPGYSSQWYLPVISAPGAWDITTGSPSIPVAVIDSGVDPIHPDLYQRLSMDTPLTSQ